jgi:folylpolyglutamate synthase
MTLQKGRVARLQQKDGEAITLMRDYVSRLDLQLKNLRVLHVAGTKGKGSVCAFAERLLREEGVKTGLFTSPHLIDVRSLPVGQPV